ncbi:hypothetical protein B0H12DRAFT_1079290, partial [Mycena haematopus]
MASSGLRSGLFTTYYAVISLLEESAKKSILKPSRSQFNTRSGSILGRRDTTAARKFQTVQVQVQFIQKRLREDVKVPRLLRHKPISGFISIARLCTIRADQRSIVFSTNLSRNRPFLPPFDSTPVPLHNDMSGSLFNGTSDSTVTGGGFYNVQGELYAQSDGHTMAHRMETQVAALSRRINSKRPPTLHIALQTVNTKGLTSKGLVRHQVMNPQGYNTGPQYAIDNVPAPNADTEIAARLRRQANLNQMPTAPPIQYAYSVPPLARSEYPRDGRGVPLGPAQLRPRSMVVPQNDSRRMGYSHDGLSSSPEEAEPSLRSSRPSSMSQFPRASQDRPPQTARNPMNINQLTSPANSSYRAGPRSHERRRGPGAARADRGSSSSSDSEDTDTSFSPPPRQSRRTSSQVSSPPPVSFSQPAQPPRRPHRQSGRGDSDSDSDSDDTAIIYWGPSRRTGGISSQHPSTSAWLPQSSSANQFPPPSRPTYPQASTPSRPTYPQ